MSDDLKEPETYDIIGFIDERGRRVVHDSTDGPIRVRDHWAQYSKIEWGSKANYYITINLAYTLYKLAYKKTDNRFSNVGWTTNSRALTFPFLTLPDMFTFSYEELVELWRQQIKASRLVEKL